MYGVGSDNDSYNGSFDDNHDEHKSNSSDGNLSRNEDNEEVCLAIKLYIHLSI